MKKHLGDKPRRILSIALMLVLALGTVVFPVQASSAVDSAQGESVTLALYRGRAEDTTPFQVRNMFPGDRETRTYRLDVSYKGSLTVHFHADIRAGYEKLAEVLKCTVSIAGVPFYDGLMRDMPQSIPYQLPESSGSTESIWYALTVYLDTSVGNDYMAKELYADFRWWVEESADVPTVPTEPTETTAPSEPTETTTPSEPTETTAPSEPTETTTPSEPTETTAPSEPTEKPTTPGELIPPKTGDTLDLCIWFWIAMASLLLNILLLSSKRHKKDDEEAER